MSVDPLSPDFPWYTPYQFAGNKPIWAIDLDGLEETMATRAQQRAQESYLKNEISAEELQGVYEAQALGAAAGGLIVGAWWTGGAAASWTFYNLPTITYELGTTGMASGAFIFGVLDESGAIHHPAARVGAGFRRGMSALVGGVKGVVSSIVRRGTKGVYNAYKPKSNTLNMGLNPFKRSKSGKFTEPTLPTKKVVEENGITLEHYYKSNDHYEGHLHVIDKSNPGGKTTIGAGGKVIEGTLSPKAKDVIKSNRTWINRSVKKINKWLKFHSPSTVKGVEKPPLKDS